MAAVTCSVLMLLHHTLHTQTLRSLSSTPHCPLEHTAPCPTLARTAAVRQGQMQEQGQCPCARDATGPLCQGCHRAVEWQVQERLWMRRDSIPQQVEGGHSEDRQDEPTQGISGPLLEYLCSQAGSTVS